MKYQREFDRPMKRVYELSLEDTEFSQTKNQQKNPGN